MEGSQPQALRGRGRGRRSRSRACVVLIVHHNCETRVGSFSLCKSLVLRGEESNANIKCGFCSKLMLVVCCVLICLAEGNSLAIGFGDEIQWHPWSEGLATAKNYGQPIMLILHKSWCKPQFAASTEIKRLSSQFVMVNIAEDK